MMSKTFGLKNKTTCRVRLILMALIFCLLTPLSQWIHVSALTPDDAVTKLQTIMKKEYPQGKKFESTGFNNSWQCFGFAKKIIYLLTGDITNWKYNGQAVSGLVQIAQLKKGNYKKDNMLDFIAKAQPGDIIQADTGSKERQHTMIFCWLNANGTFTVYDANTNGKNSVSIREITYQRWSSKTWNHISLLRSVKMKNQESTIKEKENPKQDIQNVSDDAFLEYLFDYEFYAGRYEDLREEFGYEEEALYDHWLTIGIKEGRTASPALDLPYYLALNPDLSKEFKMDYEAAYEHFITKGCNEFRKSSSLYDPAEYKEQSLEFKKLNGKELLITYLDSFE